MAKPKPKPKFNIAETDSEALETLRQWWQKYGKYAGAGLVLAFGGLGGWQGWDYYRGSHALEAAKIYVAFAKELEAGEESDETLPELPSHDYADTPYLPFAYFQRARHFVEHGQLEEAAEDLLWVAENSVQPDLSELAYIRYARVLVAMGKTDEARNVLDVNAFHDAFIPLVQETRGDALLQKNDIEGAIASYRAAWEASFIKSEFLRLKLESFGRQVSASTAPVQ